MKNKKYEFVSVKDELPKLGSRVIGSLKEEFSNKTEYTTLKLFYDKQGRFMYDSYNDKTDEVTDWMPWPEPIRRRRKNPIVR
jgi:hypothetical protein